jgi:hypothetical protein
MLHYLLQEFGAMLIFSQIFPVLGAPLAWFMGLLFHLLHLPRFPETISLILLLWMGWCLLRCWREISPMKRRLIASRRAYPQLTLTMVASTVYRILRLLSQVAVTL